MKKTSFLEEKIWFIIFILSFTLGLCFLMSLFEVNFIFIIVTAAAIIGYTVLYLVFEYFKIRRLNRKIIKLTDKAKEKYLIADMLGKPKGVLNEAYFYALKKATKSMNDKIAECERNKTEYREYIESLCHEIKTPVSALSLIADNSEDKRIKAQTDKIDNLVEQMLFYARSDDTEKDYFVREIDLSDLVNSVVLKYCDLIVSCGVTLDIHDLNNTVFTDEKWLSFIVSQIVQNSIKYFDKDTKIISVFSLKNDNSIELFIRDNGRGIDKTDLSRVFEKGFTGSDRKKENSTGLGLYLANKLCERLGLSIEITSEKGEFTETKITFPLGKIRL